MIRYVRSKGNAKLRRNAVIKLQISYFVLRKIDVLGNLKGCLPRGLLVSPPPPRLSEVKFPLSKHVYSLIDYLNKTTDKGRCNCEEFNATVSFPL